MSEDNKVELNEKDGIEIEYDMEALRSKATLMGIKFNPKIGGQKLKEKIDLHIRDMELKDVVDESKNGISSAGPSNKIRDIEKRAREPLLVVISDLDTRDIDNPTLVHGVMNGFFKIGPVIIKKDEEQYVPRAIIEGLKVKTMVKMVPSVNNITKRPTGNKVAETRKRYSITYISE